MNIELIPDDLKKAYEAGTKQVQTLIEQLTGCLIASRDYEEGVKFGESLESGFGEAFKEVLRCRQTLDRAEETIEEYRTK